LCNSNAFAVDISGWRVAGAVSFKFRGGTVIPAGGSLYLTPSVNAFRARTNGPGGGQNLYVQGPCGGYLGAKGTSALYLCNASLSVVASNSAAAYSALQFVAGNLAVLRVGDGVESLSSKGNSVFIDQFSTNGALCNSIAVPDNASNSLVISGSASSEGGLTLSGDGRLLLLAGYRVALTNSASSLSGATAAAVPRVLAVLDGNGAFALVGCTSNQFSKNNIRSGVSDGCGNYWGAGANSGTVYFGDATPATVQSNVANTRIIQQLGGNLCFSTGSGTAGLYRIAGTPRQSNGAPALVLSAAAASSPYGFAFNTNFTTAYVADDTLAGQGGVQRWDMASGSWSLSYVFYALTNVGARGLAVDFSGAVPLIYATTTEASTNRLVAIADAGPNSPAVALATAGANQVFRGVAFTPVTPSAPRFVSACRATNGFRLSWTALIGKSYTVQAADSLSSPAWTTVTNLTTSGPMGYALDPSIASLRFYRVVLGEDH
jgi:hypothetical protein